MIRHTHVSHLFDKITLKKEEVKQVEEPVIVKKTRRKTDKKVNSIEEPTIVVEEPIVVEEKIEDEDLSKWLEEHTED